MYYWPMLITLIIVHIAVGVILVRKYRTTQDQGLLWLGVLLVIWPLVISPLLSYGVGRAIDVSSSGNSPDFFPFTLIRDHQITIGTFVALFQYLLKIMEGLLALIAVMLLYRRWSTPKPASTSGETKQDNSAIPAPKAM